MRKAEKKRQREISEPYVSGAPELWRSGVANVGVYTHSPTIRTATGFCAREEWIQQLGPPAYRLDTQGAL